MSIFDEELQRLKEKLLKMGSLVEDAIKNSIRALVERDNTLAASVIDNDRVINTRDVEIDEVSIPRGPGSAPVTQSETARALSGSCGSARDPQRRLLNRAPRFVGPDETCHSGLRSVAPDRIA